MKNDVLKVSGRLTKNGQELVSNAWDRARVLQDYRLAFRSRQASLIGRRETLSGKAKFGIFGDGKEIAQIALAKAFRKGDFRSGYYRDQTLMLALGALTLQEFFAQLYAHADVDAEPATAGRAMNGHFATRLLNPDGSWKDLMASFNSAADVSPTGSQMPRLVGLAYASRLYRELEALKSFTQFSDHGNEVAFGTIGNAATAEGLFWEAVNAIGVLKAPAVITIYDDGYGISVTNEHQMVKADIAALLSGFLRTPGERNGFDIYRTKGWDYPGLIETYRQAAETAREEHVPAIVHVIELTQPQGHSTSGSHERYKSNEQLEWEDAHDALGWLRQWVIAQGFVGMAELEAMEIEDRRQVEAARKAAWQAYQTPIQNEARQAAALIEQSAVGSEQSDELHQVKDRLLTNPAPLRRDAMASIRAALVILKDEESPGRQALVEWKRAYEKTNEERYGSHLYSQSAGSALNVAGTPPVYSGNSPLVHGFDVLNACFDAALQADPRVLAFGEDVGQLGDVNQGMRGLQQKYGTLRVSDTGIREATIIGQAIGLALRGFRPIAEIQYLDYLLYALQILSDDLAMLHWRTRGGQKAPVIVRTRGHRLEGIWHSGSPMAAIIHLLRGMHVVTPRNMTQAAGFYNTLLRSDEPAVVVEVLNGYRVRERLPDNIGAMRVPLGVPEILRTGRDVTLVTYGACCRIVMDAADVLSRVGIEAEVIDVQTLLPFDRFGAILESLKKTSRIVFIDEDVPGGTTAYMLQEVIEKQGGYAWLDSPPRTLAGAPHRPAYGSDGDYWSKPNVEQVFELVYGLMRDSDPGQYPVDGW
jgi:pyruvate/2-oxoglutarate/acetoin dehydrogenase E1 component/TPP-dependent pyruvate/acetoin dehydrogenase alpha subunit